MDDTQRRDDGMAQRRKVLGNEWVDKSVKNRNAFNTDFQELITRNAWGDIWTRPHFDDRTRRVLVLGTMVALDNGTNSACTCALRSPRPVPRPMTSGKSCCSSRSIAACRRPTTR